MQQKEPPPESASGNQQSGVAEALGLTEIGADLLTDSRLGSNKQHLLVPLLRQSIYSRLAGYEDVNDAERLCVDPAMRHVVGGRASQPEKQAASSSEVGRFETEKLSQRYNLTALMNLSRSNWPRWPCLGGCSRPFSTGLNDWRCRHSWSSDVTRERNKQ